MYSHPPRPARASTAHGLGRVRRKIERIGIRVAGVLVPEPEDHHRARQRDLHRERRPCLRVPQLIHAGARSGPDPLGDRERDRHGHGVLGLLAVELDRPAGERAEPVEPRHEELEEDAPAHLPVGGDVEADVLLEAQRLVGRAVLDPPIRPLVDPSRAEGRPCLDQRLGRTSEPTTSARTSLTTSVSATT